MQLKEEMQQLLWSNAWFNDGGKSVREEVMASKQDGYSDGEGQLVSVFYVL